MRDRRQGKKETDKKENRWKECNETEKKALKKENEPLCV